MHYVPKRRSEVGGYDGGGGGANDGGWSEERREDREESITSWADETEMELERQMKSMELEKEQQQGGGGRGVSGAAGRGGRGRGARGRGWNSFSHGEHDDRIGGPEDGDSEYVRFVQVLHCILIAFFMLTTGVYICLLSMILIKRFLTIAGKVMTLAGGVLEKGGLSNNGERKTRKGTGMYRRDRRRRYKTCGCSCKGDRGPWWIRWMDQRAQCLT